MDSALTAPGCNTIIDPALEQQILALGEGNYSHLRVTNGEVMGLGRYLYTWALMVGMGHTLWDAPCRRRYCYEHKSDAMRALMFWDGLGDPPGPWIKRKGIDCDEALGPGALK